MTARRQVRGPKLLPGASLVCSRPACQRPALALGTHWPGMDGPWCGQCATPTQARRIRRMTAEELALPLPPLVPMVRERGAGPVEIEALRARGLAQAG